MGRYHPCQSSTKVPSRIEKCFPNEMMPKVAGIMQGDLDGTKLTLTGNAESFVNCFLLVAEGVEKPVGDLEGGGRTR